MAKKTKRTKTKRSMSLSEIRALAEKHAREDLRDGTYPNPRPPVGLPTGFGDIKRFGDEKFLLGIITGGVITINAQAYRLREALVNRPQLFSELINFNDELIKISNKMNGILTDLND